MKKIFISLLLACAILPMSAQVQRGLKDTYILDSFPQVTFVWNTPNPEVISPENFSLFEETSKVDFTCTALPVDETPLQKSILFLWEDMASHAGQSDFVRKVLQKFFNETSISTGDRFEVAYFDRNKTGYSLLNGLIGKFSTDRKALLNAVTAHKNNTGKYSSPLETDLYQAINDGIDLLKKETGRMGVIVVFTKGNNFKSSGGIQMEAVRKKAQEAGIPIYAVKYTNAADTPEMNLLAESTYGEVIATTTKDFNGAYNSLKQCYKNLDRRLHGRDYKFKFKALAERDGKPHRMRLEVDKVNQIIPPYTAPEVTFWMWIQENLILCIAIFIAFVALVVLLVILLVKKRKERESAMQGAMQQEMGRVRSESAEQVRRSNEALENMRREQAEKERSRQAAEEEQRLMQLMKTKNLYPRLQCRAGAETFSYTIGKPCVTLGRNASNDVAFTMKNASFNNQTVSGYHADIVFNGANFEVVNKSTSYTQGIIVNGQLHQRCPLKNGDMIGLGEAVVTFYM